MTGKLRILLASCAMGTLTVPLAGCGPATEWLPEWMQASLPEGVAPGWSLMDMASVDPEFLSASESAPLPQALPLQRADVTEYRLAPSYDYVPGVDDYYEPLDESYYDDDDEDYYDYDYEYEMSYESDSYYDDTPYRIDDDSNDIALLALAVSLAALLGDSPPDYGFGYAGVSPWAWGTGDGYYRYAEPVYGGYRYYYYAPGAYRPFFVCDPYYSYGYRGDRLAVIYDHDGRRINPSLARVQVQAANTYYARAGQLYRAAQRDRYGVSGPLWARQRGALASEREQWLERQAARPAWGQWEARNVPRLQRQWSGEALVRRDAEGRFGQWQRADFRTPAPALYTREARAQQVRQVAELRRERAPEIAERRREREDVRVAQRAESRRIATERREVARAPERSAPAAERRTEPRSEPARVVSPREQREERRVAAAPREVREDRRTPDRPVAQRQAASRPQPERTVERRTAAEPRRQETTPARAAERQPAVREDRTRPQPERQTRTTQPQAQRQQPERTPRQPEAQPQRQQPERAVRQQPQRQEPERQVRQQPQRQEPERQVRQQQQQPPQRQQPQPQARPQRQEPQPQARPQRQEPQPRPQASPRQQRQEQESDDSGSRAPRRNRD